MRVTTYLSIDLETGRVIRHEWHEYVGPVALAKKGRDTTNKAASGETGVASTASNLAASDKNVQNNSRNISEPFATSLIPGKNGALSSYATSQFGREKEQIAKNYGDVAQAGLRSLGNRGLGAPGASSSVINTAGRNADDAITGAYNEAKQSTLNQGLAGINYYQGQQQIYDPNRPLNTASGAYTGLAGIGAQQNKQGSTLGDIGAGLSTVGKAAALAG